jgi:hypothetical protein
MDWLRGVCGPKDLDRLTASLLGLSQKPRKVCAKVHWHVSDTRCRALFKTAKCAFSDLKAVAQHNVSAGVRPQSTAPACLVSRVNTAVIFATLRCITQTICVVLKKAVETFEHQLVTS